MNAEPRIRVSGIGEPISKEFKRSRNVLDVQKALATYVLK